MMSSAFAYAFKELHATGFFIYLFVRSLQDILSLFDHEYIPGGYVMYKSMCMLAQTLRTFGVLQLPHPPEFLL
jgi:hypothetical protein